MLMAAGWGWIGGTFPWSGNGLVGQVLITVVHLVPVVLVLGALWALVTDQRTNYARVVLTVLACVVKILTAVAAVWAATHPGGFGPHSLLDWVPIGLVNAGGGLWLLGLIRGRASQLGQ